MCTLKEAHSCLSACVPEAFCTIKFIFFCAIFHLLCTPPPTTHSILRSVRCVSASPSSPPLQSKREDNLISLNFSQKKLEKNEGSAYMPFVFLMCSFFFAPRHTHCTSYLDNSVQEFAEIDFSNTHPFFLCNLSAIFKHFIT